MGVLVSWSGGKDAAYAYETLCQNGNDVQGLFVTIGEATQRVSMHGVRPALIAAQAEALDVDLEIIPVPGDGTHAGYEQAMQAAFQRIEPKSIAYADLLLEDVKNFRAQLLAPLDIDGCWPLWERDTAVLAREVIDQGVRAVIVAVDGSQLPPETLGTELSHGFLDALPPDIDPCGEHGEFHTFVVDGPSFDRHIGVRPGRRITRVHGDTPYHYLDLLPSPQDG